jgi:quercetin dioxygenase-like cupin family protein
LTLVTAAAVSMLLLAGCGSDEPAASGSAAPSAVSAGPQVLLDAQELTVLDQPLKYLKKKPAQISSSILTLEPGQETGWHKHPSPIYVYILEGSISVEYDAGVVKDYQAGTAFLEAVGTWHNGTNKGDAPVRILVVNMGAKDVANAVKRP